MTHVLLSRRAIRDLEEIRHFSVERWGKSVAEEYIITIEEALNRLRADSNLLRIKPEFSPHFRFYRVRRHFLICSQIENNVYVLAVRHGSLDLPTRLAELEPTLLRETDLLHKACAAKMARNRGKQDQPDTESL